MNHNYLAKFLAAFSALSAGISIVGTRLILPETDPQTMAVIRFGIGAVDAFSFGFAKIDRPG